MADKILKCPRCQEILIYDKREGYWICPFCNGQWWDDEQKLEVISQEEKYRLLEQENYHRQLWTLGAGYRQAALPPIPARNFSKRSSGNKSRRRKRRKQRRYTEARRFTLV